jgi:hydroxyacylglutathione hydrolase
MIDPGSAVIRIRNRGFAANTYVCALREPGRCVVIDPGLDGEAITSALATAALEPVAILCTHGHFDHLGSAETLRRTYGAPVHVHPADSRVVDRSNFLMMAFRLPNRIELPQRREPLEDGVPWTRGEDRIEVIHAPGHTPGSVVLRFGDAVFSGDTIYRDAVFLGQMPEADDERLARTLGELWDRLPDGAFIHPGHGGGDLFGRIKAANQPFRRLVGRAEQAAS